MVKAFKRLLRDQNGAILPIFGVLVIILVVIGGAAIDVSRAISAREKLAYAIDAAALSVAATLSTGVMNNDDIKNAISGSFQANLEGETFLQQAIDNSTFVVDSNAGTVTITSSAMIDNYFINMGGYGLSAFGPDVFTIGTGARVNYSRFDVELALIVDVTGSMRSDMTTLREASQSVVDILLPADVAKEKSKVRISLIPYSQGVNLGSYANKVIGGEHYSVSGQCVTEREDYGPYEVQYTDAAYNYYIDANPPPKETFFGGGSTSCSSSSKVIPLTNDRDILTPAIAALQASGATAGQTGALWGWISLSPNFANVWPTESVPATYSNPDVLKFAIMMTDGDNNRHYYQTDQKCSGRYCWTVSPKYWRDTNYRSYGYSGTSSKRHREYCDKMKAAGIEVFGVYFGNNNSSVGARNMQSCASSGNYYQASSRDGLIQAFSNIAKKVQNIYLSQ